MTHLPRGTSPIPTRGDDRRPATASIDRTPALPHELRVMPKGIGAAALLAVVTFAGAPPPVAAAQSAPDLASQAIQECVQGQDAGERQARKAHFERGEALATQAVSLDDRSADAHFGVVCNLGELLRLDGEKLTSVFGLRRLLSEIDRTLALDPDHIQAMATKGNLLMRLPRMFGGNAQEGERLLHEVVRRDATAVTSRITLARVYQERGRHEEALQFAGQALLAAKQKGRADKIAEAQATLDQLGAPR